MNTNAEEEAEKLSDEAKNILHVLLKIPEGCQNESINRLVDCVVLASALQMAAWQHEAMQKYRVDTPNATRKAGLDPPYRAAEAGQLERRVSTYTPGPWEYGEDADGEWYFEASQNRGVQIGWCCNYGDHTAEPNARLISAAPDLLEALIEVVGISDRKHDAWDKAKAAIRKATSDS